MEQYLLAVDHEGNQRKEYLQDVRGVRSAGSRDSGGGELEILLQGGKAPLTVRVGDGFDVSRLQALFSAFPSHPAPASAAQPKPSRIGDPSQSISRMHESTITNGVTPPSAMSSLMDANSANSAPSASPPPVFGREWERQREEMHNRLRVALSGEPASLKDL